MSVGVTQIMLSPCTIDNLVIILYTYIILYHVLCACALEEARSIGARSRKTNYG